MLDGLPDDFSFTYALRLGQHLLAALGYQDLIGRAGSELLQAAGVAGRITRVT